MRKNRFGQGINEVARCQGNLAETCRGKVAGNAVEVNGDFDAFHLGVPPEELVATVLRFVTSVVVVPIQRIFEGKLPADGEATCLAAWRKPSERQ